MAEACKPTPMRFDVYVSGHFQNVKSITAEQTYPVLLRCAACNTEHAKYASLAHADARQREGMPSTASVSCASCGSAMEAVAEPPKAERVRCTSAEDGRCCWAFVALGACSAIGFCVSTITTTNCTVVDVPKLELDVVTEQCVLFEDVPLEENSWTGISKDNPCALIDSYEILVRDASSSSGVQKKRADDS